VGIDEVGGPTASRADVARRLISRALLTIWRAGAWLRSKAFWGYVATVGCVLGFGRVFWILCRPLVYNGINYDEMFFLWGGWSITKGLVPYRDFQDFKPPIVFLVNAAAVALLGVPRQRVHFFFAGLLFVALTVLFLALVRQRIGRVLALITTLGIAYVLLDPFFHDSSLNDAETIGLSFLLMGVGTVLWGGRHVAVTDTIGGVCFVFAVFSKEPYAVGVFATWAALGFRRRDVLGPGTLKPYVRWTVTGAAIALAALVGYLAVTRGLRWYVRLLGHYLSFSNICERIGLSPKLPVGKTAWPELWAHLKGHLLKMDYLGPLVPFFLAAGFGVRERIITRVALAATIVGSMYVVGLGRCYFRHYYMLAVAGLVLWVIFGALALSDQLRAAPRRTHVFVVALLAIFVLPRIGDRYESESKKEYEANDFIGHGSDVPAEDIDFVTKNSAPADRLFTNGPPGLYVFANRRSVVRESAFLDEFIELHPGNTDVERVAPIRQQLMANPPKVIVLDPHYQERRKRHLNALIRPFIKELGYREVGPRYYVRP
jgi:hypothetical protein